MKTRTKATTKTVQETESSTTPKNKLSPDAPNPPQLFILPAGIGSEARILSLTNPRYDAESRYIICPELGLYEFTKVAAPKTTPRSWLLSSNDNTGREAKDETRSSGYITKAADLFIATPIDSMFFLLPALAPKQKTSEPTRKLFLSCDDYFERMKDESPQLAFFLPMEPLRKTLERRMLAICETVNAGDETMYRLSEEKLLQELFNKAKRMVERGLPSSMEDKLIRKALEVPMLSTKRDENSLNETANEGETEASAETLDTQTTMSTTDSAGTSFSEASTAATSFSESSTPPIEMSESALPSIETPEGVADLLRIRTAFLFICSNYLSSHLSEGLKKKLLSSASPIDFNPLDTYLAYLAKLRQEALAARSMGDYSRKRAIEEDDEEIEIRAEKKRKKEDEEKRKKAGVSVGARKLAKANVSGMKKMSEFFKKK